MAKINGSQLLVYADGALIAAQKSCTVSWEQDLPGATTKDSSGWEEHINGTRRATCDFDGLYSTAGLTADGLITYILSRSSVILLIDGGGFPIVGKATPKGVTIAAAMEDTATISGSFKFSGPAWMLTGTFANLITDPDAGGTDYDTLTISGTAITSAINAGGGAYTHSNTFAITDTSSYMCITYLNSISGEKPSITMYTTPGAVQASNAVVLVSEINFVTLVATATGNAILRIYNAGAANFATSTIYLFKI